MSKKHTLLTALIGLFAAAVMVAAVMPPSSHAKKWQAGKGWGWVWGKDDEVGALNEMTDASRLAALKMVRKGKVFDLGLSYDRTSYKWPGHSPGEIIMFRSPDGVKSQKDIPGVIQDNPSLTAWHSCALFINDNVATQIDGLGHATQGKDNHWYNGFKESDSAGDWGIRKCDATTIPPIVARGVMIDVAAYKGVKALPSNYEITPADLQGALKKQGTTLRFGDVVLVRTGTTQFWGTAGSDHETVDRHDSAGINLDSARWLVEEKGSHDGRRGHQWRGVQTHGRRQQGLPREIRLLHAGPQLPADRAGSPHRGVSRLGGALSQPRLRVHLRLHREQDPGHRGGVRPAPHRHHLSLIGTRRKK